MEHTPKCLEVQAEIATARAQYTEQWPSHCRDCNGWGGLVSSYDPSPASVSLGSGCYFDFDPCTECYEKGICPRCGGAMAEDQDLFDDDTPCTHCGFKEGDDGNFPDDHDCGCWEKDMPAWDDSFAYFYGESNVAEGVA